MADELHVLEKQFDDSLYVTKWYLVFSGVKITRKPWNKFIEYFVNKQLCFWDFIILHTVVIGEIYGTIDCIQTGKSIVDLSYNLPCITITILASVKIIFLYLNREILIELVEKLKEIHCENDLDDYAEIEIVENRRKIVNRSINMLKTFIFIMCSISVIVVVMFCIVPALIMAYDYKKTGELVIFYPYLVKYHFFDAYKSSWWPLIYFHQVLATVVTCAYLYGCDTLFYYFCTYIEMHFRLLGVEFENIVTISKSQTKRNLAKAIRRHQELIHLVNQTEHLYSKSTLFHIVTASLLICLSAFIITITDEINVKLSYFTFLMMSLSQISLVCFFSDMLMRASTEVSGSLYNCQWHEADGDAKKIILLIMIRSQKACKLTAWRFLDLNLGAFSRILSTSWSYFALLKTMYK